VVKPSSCSLKLPYEICGLLSSGCLAYTMDDMSTNSFARNNMDLFFLIPSPFLSSLAIIEVADHAFSWPLPEIAWFVLLVDFMVVHGIWSWKRSDQNLARMCKFPSFQFSPLPHLQTGHTVEIFSFPLMNSHSAFAFFSVAVPNLPWWASVLVSWRSQISCSAKKIRVTASL